MMTHLRSSQEFLMHKPEKPSQHYLFADKSFTKSKCQSKKESKPCHLNSF